MTRQSRAYVTEYPDMHPEDRVAVLYAYALLTKGRRELKHRGVLDQLWAMARRWA